MLIDCGKKLVSLLKLPMEEISNYGVILGSGIAIKGKGICENVELMISECKVVDISYPWSWGSGCNLSDAMVTLGSD